MANVRVIIKVEGGLVQDVFVSKNADVSVDVIDWDSAEQDDEYRVTHAEPLAQEVDEGLEKGTMKAVIF